MSNLPTELKYAKSHEGVRNEGDGTVTVGITEHAQEIKAASDVYSPLSGEVTEVNVELADAPETINQDAFGDGWMFKLKAADISELDKLLDADAYAEVMQSEEH